MPKSAPMSPKEQIVFPQILSLLDETLNDLASRLRFLHLCWVGTTEEEKAQFGWCIAIGVLAHDIGSTIPGLINQDRLRAAKILNRSLFEYRLALNVYKESSARALQDASEAPKELRRFFDGTPFEKDELELTSEEVAFFEEFIKEHSGKPKRRNVYKDLELVHNENKQKILFEYCNFYDFASALAHAGGLIFKDSLQVEKDDTTVLAWKSPYLTPFSTVIETFVFLVGILEAIETTANRGRAWAVILRKYKLIIKPIIDESKYIATH